MTVGHPKRLDAPEDFCQAAEELGIAFDPGDLERLGLFLGLVLDANRRFNLTAITKPDEAWCKHVLDSLTLLPYVIAAGAKRVIDVGSGAGLPGIPLAITMPQVHFRLLEATGKKAAFLEGLISGLALSNVEVINERAETIGHDHRNHRERYDLVVARAVGRMAVLLELTTPLVRVGGHVLAIKGRKAPQEIVEAKQALARLRCRVVEATRTRTGTIVSIEKTGHTPAGYPRRPGEPRRAPLGG